MAGNIEWESLKAQIGRLFDKWEPGRGGRRRPEAARRSPCTSRRTRSRRRSRSPTRACRSGTRTTTPRGTSGVLSGGMARLFTEVREKRGLCYSVGVGYETYRDRGTMVGYAGTGAARAQETLDVTFAELNRLKDGITDDEIDRVKAGLKSSLIMAEESTRPARAPSPASGTTSAASARSTRFSPRSTGSRPPPSSATWSGTRSATSRSSRSARPR